MATSEAVDSYGEMQLVLHSLAGVVLGSGITWAGLGEKTDSVLVNPCIANKDEVMCGFSREVVLLDSGDSRDGWEEAHKA
ncbi:hypothetical protein N7471_006193 [Penicillium samsonianum]|uniref:uncharacterized protein n=1 Tax=Penicillium samsonianum TaxID=1882272 RepID=UPI0025481715|nr:uncharacterized protein N7471_006193 [Penicillium samsonianum]KAJ6139707.1 hypothetical protein N7471_006193 [Penicillium samsonianum]